MNIDITSEEHELLMRSLDERKAQLSSRITSLRSRPGVMTVNKELIARLQEEETQLMRLMFKLRD